MNKRAVFAILSVSVFLLLATCSKSPTGPTAPKFPSGYPQSAAEIAQLYDSLSDFLYAVHPGSYVLTYGMAEIDMGDTNAYGNATSVVFSACTASVRSHCLKLDPLYAETTSTVFGVQAYQGQYHFYDSVGYWQGNSIALIKGRYDRVGVAQERRLYIGGSQVLGVRPDLVKISFSDSLHPFLIIKNWSFYHATDTRSSYQAYDILSGKLFDYGKY